MAEKTMIFGLNCLIKKSEKITKTLKEAKTLADELASVSSSNEEDKHVHNIDITISRYEHCLEEQMAKKNENEFNHDHSKLVPKWMLDI